MNIVVESGRVVNVLERVKRSLKRKGFVMGLIAERLANLIGGTFEEQRDPWGRPWERLKQTTLDIRARRGSSSNEILIDSYTLYGSMTKSSTDDYAQVEFQGADEYAWVQQFGNPLNTMFGRGNAPIPARPFMPIKNAGAPRLDLPDSWVAALTQPLENELRKAIQ